MLNNSCDCSSREEPSQTSVVPKAELVPPIHIVPHHVSVSISAPLFPPPAVYIPVFPGNFVLSKTGTCLLHHNPQGRVQCLGH